MKVGEHDLSTNNDDAKLIKVKKIHNHPNYNNPVSENNDFSILELDEDLTFSESVRPACLPQSDASTYAELDGKSTVCYLFIGITKKRFFFQLWYPDGEPCHKEDPLPRYCKR